MSHGIGGCPVFASCLLSLCLAGAPIPEHLFPPPPPHPVKPGFRWYFSGMVLGVDRVEGDCVTYRCLSCPGRFWGGCDGYPGPNQQSRKRCWDEAIRWGVPK